MMVKHFLVSLRHAAQFFVAQLRQDEHNNLKTPTEPAHQDNCPEPTEKALRESERMLRAVTSSLPIMLFVVNREGRLTLVNTTGMGALPPRDWGTVGRTVWESYADLPQILENCRRGLAGESFYSEVLVENYILDIYVAPLRDDDGESDGFISVAMDITERRRAQIERDELMAREQAAQAQLANMLNSITDGFYALDRNWNFTYVNKKAEEVLAHSYHELVGSQIWQLFPEARETVFLTEFQRAMNEGQTIEFEAIYPKTNKWFSMRVYPAPEGISVFFLDVTGRKQAETLQRDLLLRLTTAQEEERWRIARDLHDQLGQDLAVLMLGLKSLPQHGIMAPSALACVQELQETVTQLVRQVRHVALNLRSESLGALGLSDALRHYVQQWSQHYNIPVTFHTWGFQGAQLASYIEATVYRIVQESFTNVSRHSNARHVSVVLERRDDHILLIVEDDGEGFDVEATLNGPFSERGLGLQGMKERAALVGGTFQIESPGEQGTTIYVRIPAEDKTDETPSDLKGVTPQEST